MTHARARDPDPRPPEQQGQPDHERTAVTHPDLDTHTDLDAQDGPDRGGDPSLDGSVPERTGHPAVDEVLASLAGLEERPVAEHVAVFEAAHDRLRAALADAGGTAERTSGS